MEPIKQRLRKKKIDFEVKFEDLTHQTNETHLLTYHPGDHGF